MFSPNIHRHAPLDSGNRYSYATQHVTSNSTFMNRTTEIKKEDIFKLLAHFLNIYQSICVLNIFLLRIRVVHIKNISIYINFFSNIELLKKIIRMVKNSTHKF